MKNAPDAAAGSNRPVTVPCFLLCPSILLMTVLLVFCAATTEAAGTSPAPLFIGLDADLSAGSAQAGLSIHSGALIAVEEINANGGVLGRPLALESRDHRGNPARALDNIAELAQLPDLVAILGGLHTPAALEVLPLVHKHRIPFLIPWAAGRSVVDNGYNPNFVFRVSIRDSDAGPFLVDAAIEEGYRQLGLLLENTGWGRSNHTSMMAAAAARNLPPPEVQWFNWGARDFRPQLEAFRAHGVDVILLVANPPEGVLLTRTIAAMPPDKRLPIISHWGITGGTFAQRAGATLDVIDLRFLQTFNFASPAFPERSEKLAAAYRRLFPDVENPLDIPAAPGLVHAYDLVHLLARAISAAGTADRAAVRDALLAIDHHPGVMADYSPPFQPERHDALGPCSFILARYNKAGQVVPISTTEPRR